MSEVILDASALLALLNDEPGAGKVAEVLAEARMSSVNLACRNCRSRRRSCAHRRAATGDHSVSGPVAR